MKKLWSISLCLSLFLGCLAAPLFAEGDVAQTARTAAKNLDAAAMEMADAKNAKHALAANKYLKTLRG